jgi:hypothetical protein
LHVRRRQLDRMQLILIPKSKFNQRAASIYAERDK